MNRPSLLDVNVLVALFSPDHIHHETAHDWFADHRGDGWATCPTTELGLVRILSNPTLWPGERAAAVVDRLRRFCSSGHHVFWPNAVSLRDDTVFDLAVTAGYRQLTDIYLLGLARKMGGRLATFDRRIAVKAVKGAGARTLAVIETVTD